MKQITQAVIGIVLFFGIVACGADNLPASTELKICNRPANALPSGSYHKSCNSCEVKGQGGADCHLSCICDGKQISANLSECAEDNYCNNHAHLQCGEC